jgi:hypothetical protein
LDQRGPQALSQWFNAALFPTNNGNPVRRLTKFQFDPNQSFVSAVG